MRRARRSLRWTSHNGSYTIFFEKFNFVVFNSEFLKSVFQDKLKRANHFILRYEVDLDGLQKGFLFCRKISEQEYFYLN